tara:strand:- start:2134 stop:3162 length:1029 start_codon:yes stop_codon:yes gene_type:complete
MKIALGSKIQKGPWGGGNQFLNNFKNYFEKKGHSIYFDLKNKDLDIILLTDPRPKSSSASFNHFDIEKYLKYNCKALVVYRFNECDERKNTTGINKSLIFANDFADYSVFISTWLRDLYCNLKIFNNNNSTVILNGADNKVFFKSLKKNKSKKISLITHHWSSHINKGFDCYKEIDNLFNDKEFKDNFDFTFVGNLPRNFKFKYTNYIEPKSGMDLSNILREHHVYITASKNEPGGNHQNEGLNCGLPVLYMNSGCMPEYCQGFGISFNKTNLKEKIYEIKNRYYEFRNKVKDYKINATNMCKNYEFLFQYLVKNKDYILSSRNKKTSNFLHKLKFILDRML